MSWPYPQQSRSLIPPMGQGLAVVASVVAIGLLSLVAIVGYLLSMQVASVNAQGQRLDAELHAKRQQVRQLQLEFDVRSRFVELERWRAALGLGPTEEQQYADGEHQLASVAAARRVQIAARQTTPGFVPNPCSPRISAPGCQATPIGEHHGYAPEARERLDSLIGDVLR